MMRDMASVASEALRSLLHQRWCGLSVSELDVLLVELSDVGVPALGGDRTDRTGSAGSR